MKKRPCERGRKRKKTKEITKKLKIHGRLCKIL